MNEEPMYSIGKDFYDSLSRSKSGQSYLLELISIYKIDVSKKYSFVYLSKIYNLLGKHLLKERGYANEGQYTEKVGCSWYCGGSGPYKITASSNIKQQGKITYTVKNIHDFNLFTAWIPENKNGSLVESKPKLVKDTDDNYRYVSLEQKGGSNRRENQFSH